MATIHISLVGGQPIPVYIGIVDCVPDKVLMICSEQTHSVACRVQNELNIPSEIIILDPVDLLSIEEKTKHLVKCFEGDHVSINIAGGTKMWTYFFVKIFGTLKNHSIFYVDQNNRVHNFTHRQSHLTGVQLDMDLRFRLHGNPLTQFCSLSNYTKKDIENINYIRRLRQINHRDFNQLVHFFSNGNDSKPTAKGGSFIIREKETNRLSITMCSRSGYQQKVKLTSPNIQKLISNSGWFEIEVARMLSEWNKTNDMRINCVFPTKSDSPKNEIDIIIDCGKLLFVECKTQINKETDIDKFRSAVNVYGGLGNKALFITDALMCDKAREKCNDNNVLAFSIEENGGVANCHQALFDLLDKELFNINPN